MHVIFAYRNFRDMKSHLRTGSTHRVDVVDGETGELLDSSVNTTTYLASSSEEFYLMYSSMVLILKGSSDVRMKLFASLLERYSNGTEFSVTKGLKELISAECKCSPRSFDTALTSLVRDAIVIRLSRSLYRINPRHVFKGSSSLRNKELKAILELHCPTC